MYTKVYKDFLGVDLTSEPSEVEDRRLHRILNMWRDYRSQEGAALETAPGFEKLASFGGKINGIHYLPAGNGAGAKLLVHAGNTVWYDDGEKAAKVLFKRADGSYTATINNAKSASVYFYGYLYIVCGTDYVRVKNGATVNGEHSDVTGYIPLTYLNGTPYEQRNLLINKVREEYVVVKDVREYFIHDPSVGISVKLDEKSLTAFAHANPGDADTGYVRYLDRDGNEITFTPSNGADCNFFYPGVTIYLGTRVETIQDGTGREEKSDFWYAVHVDTTNTITETYFLRSKDFITKAERTEDGYHIVSITFADDKSGTLVIQSEVSPTTFATVGDFKDLLSGNPDFKASSVATAKEAVDGCTLITEFDGRVFLSGNPKLPNTVFYTQRDLTGYNNPFYIGAYNYLNDGTGSTPITAMMSTATHLIVLKDEAPEGSQVYYHYGVDNTSADSVTANLQPRIYPRETGVAGFGCLGTAVNFLDDAVFLSKNGLEAVGKSQVNLERTLTHRSSYVDAGLRNEDMRKALSAEWMGYLVLLFPSGRMYLADSRLRTSHPYHGYQYEWYLWDDIGVYDGQKSRYYYTGETISVTGKTTAYDKEGYTESDELNGSDGNGEFTYVEEDGYVYAVATDGEQIGGEFKAPTAILSAGDKLYFGCEDGSLCVFNTDMENGFITNDSYTHNGRRYSTEVTTKSDNCGHTNIAKSTERHSLVVKSKAFPMVSAEVYVRTDRDDWRKVDDIYCASRFSFGAVDFTNFSFNTTLDTIERLRESEKRWTEKQISIRTECYKSPYGVISISYNYTNAGRIRRT